MKAGSQVKANNTCKGACLDLKPKVRLSELLETILKQTTIMRIRLSSIEVREIDDELLDLLTDKRICNHCNHLHIPLQSGDDRSSKPAKPLMF